MQKQIIGIFLAAIIILVLLIVLIVVEIHRPKLTKQEGCGIAHEDGDHDYEDIISSAHLRKYNKFAISVDSMYCATVGKRIFEKDGSAVDAAIAVALCNGIMNMQSMGIGGGSFMTIYIK